jgi:PPM family protein phosphatase
MNAGAATDTGLVRERNEDRYWIDAERGVFLVVDGLGGQSAGELAAETAVEQIRETLLAADAPSGRNPTQAGMPVPRGTGIPACVGFQADGSAEDLVRAAITRANNRIFELAQQEPERRGMACVLTVALVEDQVITIGHVGDSRLYLFWGGAMRKLTSDHSPVGEDEEAGALTEAEAMRHPRRNEVFRDVGSQLRTAADEDFIEIRKCRFRPDAAILLCSDGLTDQLTAAQVRAIVERYDGDADRVACELVDAANDAGGKDNTTALFIAGPQFGNKYATRPRLAITRVRRPMRLLTGRAAFLAYGLLIGMLLWAVLRAVRG